MAAAGGGDAARHPGGTAWFDGVEARRPVEWVDLLADADRVAAGGFWVVVGEFEGRVRAWRFADVDRSPAPAAPSDPDAAGAWSGPPADAWRSSLDAAGYRDAVGRVRQRIRAGDVYQVNVCRVLRAPLPGGPSAGRAGEPPHDGGAEPDARALGRVLAGGNPAPFAGGIHVPGGGPVPPVWLVSASPERFLSVADGVVASSPIKGTATTADGLTDKDRAENIMIVDMVRNDLQRVCLPGTVEVTRLLDVEEHPGLVHLVTTVEGRLRGPVSGAGADGGPSPVDWAALLAATYPPASVSGAPKLAALAVIDELEPVPRGPYCGAFGWIDADRGTASLAVGIRGFWWERDAEGGTLRFGTGAGITWDSDPDREWEETELKARRLVALASGPAAGRSPAGGTGAAGPAAPADPARVGQDDHRAERGEGPG